MNALSGDCTGRLWKRGQHWSLSIDGNGGHGFEHDFLEVVARREVLLQRGKSSIPLGHI